MAGYGYRSDHLRRPVIIDAEGRPIIEHVHKHSKGYVTLRVQRIVEHVHMPVVVSQYKHKSHVSPTITNRDGWERPDWNGTVGSPTRPIPLSGPTNNIENAMEILKAAMKSSESAPYTAPVASQTRFGTAAASRIPKRDAAYTETIDSREAARRYNNLNSSSRPFQEQGRYTGTITSEEAAQKYRCAIV